MARVVLPIELTVLDQVRVTQVPSTFCGHGGEESVATFKNRVVSRVPVGIGEPKNPGTFGKKRIRWWKRDKSLTEGAMEQRCIVFTPADGRCMFFSTWLEPIGKAFGP